MADGDPGDSEILDVLTWRPTGLWRRLFAAVELLEAESDRVEWTPGPVARSRSGLPAPGAPDGEEIRLVEYPGTLGELAESLRPGRHLAYRGLAMPLLISLSLHRPVLLEGEVGVGKTEVAKVLAGIFGRKLIRLQCYEGIDTLGRPSRRCQLAEGSALTGFPS